GRKIVTSGDALAVITYAGFDLQPGIQNHAILQERAVFLVMQFCRIRSNKRYTRTQNTGVVEQIEAPPVQLQGGIHIIKLATCFEPMLESCRLLLPRYGLGGVPALDVPAPVREVIAGP